MSRVPEGATHADYNNPDFPVYHRRGPHYQWSFWSVYASAWVPAHRSPQWVRSGVEFRLEILRK